MEDKYGPPFSVPLVIEEIEEDPSVITIQDAAYYRGLKKSWCYCF